MTLGVTGYFLAQGFQFLGLYYLPAITVTFILNLTPIFVLILGIIFLNESPSLFQFIGIIITICGVLVFFANSILFFGEILGIAITITSSIGWAVYMIIVRYYLKDDKESVIIFTTYPMALGALMLIGTTILTGNIVAVSFSGWVIILWLSVVNTAVAFALWNRVKIS